jgi:amicyanin
MNSKRIGIVIITVLAIGSGVALTLKNNDKPTMANMSGDMAMAQPAEDSSSSEPVETNQVTYKGFAVVQKTIKVKKGTTVTWTNQDTAKHDVTPDTETAEFKASELFGKGQTYSVTFNTPGTYAYHCSPHPYMKGTVEVTE